MAGIGKEIKNQILEITFQMNEKNTVDATFGKDFASILTDAEKDPSVRGMIIRGSNGFFSNGFEPDSFVGTSKKEIEAVIGPAFHICGQVLNLPFPVAMVLNGHAMGYGAILSLYADFRYMQSKQARFGFPEINIGLPIPSAPALMLQDMTGRTMTRDMILGKALKADQALQAGIIDGVFDDEESMMDRARKDISALFKFARSTVRMNREMMYARYKEIIPPAIEHDIELASHAIMAPAGQEGLGALKEGRRPDFTAVE
ncbi:MAG: enoyl-CoA hydratase/isomerase family protein [Leptospiraceae bacterium]